MKQHASRVAYAPVMFKKMKKIIKIAAMLFIFSCTGHYESKEFDTKSIFAESQKILQNNTDDTRRIYTEKLPEIFVKIGAKSVLVTKDGLYIQLSKFFVEEKGLFVPREGVKVVVGLGSDPSYAALENGVYSYVIKG